MKTNLRCFKVILLLFFFSSLRCDQNSGKALIIYGASCSGKSTLAKKIRNALEVWQIIEFDDFEIELKKLDHQITNSQISHYLIEHALFLLMRGENLIIDTNVFDGAWVMKLKPFLCGTIFVYCPLPQLLERNAIRDKRLNRSAEKSFNARKYVESTYNFFNSIALHDLMIDSSALSLHESVEICLNYYHLKYPAENPQN